MAHCVISHVIDTDASPIEGAPGCVPHCHWAPCPENGNPAAPEPLHSFLTTARESVVRTWRLKTHAQRPLVIHCGAPGDKPEHACGTQDMDCWCGPEIRVATDCGCRGGASS